MNQSEADKMETCLWLRVGLLELQYCNYVRYQKIDFGIQSKF